MEINGVHFVTCGQMKVLEKRADENGLSYYDMMENAGMGAAGIIEEDIKRDMFSSDCLHGAKVAETTITESFIEADRRVSDKKKILIFCGKGNNGGDGFVVARALSCKGYRVKVILVDGKPKTEDAIKNFELITSLGLPIVDMSENKRALMELDFVPDIIVDAIYGTGFKGQLKGTGLSSAIYINRMTSMDRIREAKTPLVYSLDIPSGLGGDIVEKAEIDENSVKAHATLVFHARKPIHMQGFAAQYTGNVVVIDIGIDEETLWTVK